VEPGKKKSRRRRSKKDSMSFRRNASAQGKLHEGAASVEAARAEDAAMKGRMTKPTDESPKLGRRNTSAYTVAAEGDRSSSNKAIPLFSVALKAAARAKDEIDRNGVVWEYDAAVVEGGAKSIRWKRYDPITEHSIEAGFQANTDHITLSSATWSLGEQLLRREGDGVAEISFIPQDATFVRVLLLH
jgi:hypothetical protein